MGLVAQLRLLICVPLIGRVNKGITPRHVSVVIDNYAMHDIRRTEIFMYENPPKRQLLEERRIVRTVAPKHLPVRPVRYLRQDRLRPPLSLRRAGHQRDGQHGRQNAPQRHGATLHRFVPHGTPRYFGRTTYTRRHAQYPPSLAFMCSTAGAIRKSSVMRPRRRESGSTWPSAFACQSVSLNQIPWPNLTPESAGKRRES